MMPTKLMARAVTMGTDARPQSAHLCNQVVAGHLVEIGVHGWYSHGIT
jgi:hypothetical protein